MSAHSLYRVNAEKRHNARLAQAAEAAKKASEAAAFAQRPFAERKAAFNLVQMANNGEVGMSTDKMQNLIGTLIVRRICRRSPKD